MVLLRGLNYDFSAQQHTKIATAPAAAAVSLVVDNTEGFANNDYLVIAPNTEKSEIVKIGAAVASDTTLTISALKFAHSVDDEVYRLPYNQMRFYSCATATGTYALVTTLGMSYADQFTTYEHTTGTSALYYKRTFYNSTSALESDIALSDYWQTSDEELIMTPEELRALLVFDSADCPEDSQLRTIMRLAQDRMTLDISTSDPRIQRIAFYLISRSYVFKSLASKALSKGYVTIEIEGRTIIKAYQEIILLSENAEKDYMIFIRSNVSTEASKTDFLTDTELILPETRRQILDNLSGFQNAADFNQPARFYGRRRRYQ